MLQKNISALKRKVEGKFEDEKCIMKIRQYCFYCMLSISSKVTRADFMFLFVRKLLLCNYKSNNMVEICLKSKLCWYNFIFYF